MTSKSVPIASWLWLRAASVLALVCSAGWLPAPNLSRVAAQEGLNLVALGKDRIRVDGAVGDWRGIRFSELGDGDDGSMSFALGYDDQGLYLAAVVDDDRLVRTAHPGVKEDAVVFTLAVPTDRGGWSGSEVWLYAGIAGRQAASASLARVGGKPRRLRGVQVVEGPAEGERGYVLEAYVPWKRVPGGRHWRRGKGCIRLRDVDRASRSRRLVKKEVVWAGLDPRRLRRLPLLQADGVTRTDPLKAFLRSRGLVGIPPRFDLRGDVCGDRRRERVSLVSRYAVVTGNGHREGEGFSFLELPVEMEADVRAARLRDLTGNGKKELLVRIRQRADWGAHELWQVISFSSQRGKVLFAAQARVETAEGFAESKLGFGRRRRGCPPTITLAVSRVEGLDRANFRRPSFDNVEPVILPWDMVVERVYAWDGSRFDVISEKTNDELAAAGQGGARGAGSKTGSGAIRRGASAKQLVAAFRRARGIPAGVKARFRRRANLAEDRRKESLSVVDRWLLVAGPGFRGGTSCFYFALPVQDASDILQVKTVDFTGDGRHEVMFRIRQSVGDLERELVCIHSLGEGDFRRLLAVEVARRQGRNRVENRVRLARRGRKRILEIRARQARGWSRSTYPYVSEKRDGIDPLLLPWQGHIVRYRFDTGGLATRM